MTTFQNHAAWLTAKSARPLTVKPAPYTSPGPLEIVIKNGAIAVNPVDWFKQVIGNFMFPWIKYPFILGSDVAGEVIEVGKDVTRFRIGDRVIGHAIGIDEKVNKAAESAFQLYSVVKACLAAPIPSNLSYEDCCVLPLGLSTAACGMFQKDFLALEYPAVSSTTKPNGKTLLVWGGSTSVGSNAIQLAVAAGYEVITTASPKNFNYVKKLGATAAFDYNSTTVVYDIVQVLKGKKCAGAIAIGSDSVGPCIDIIAASEGVKFVAQASAPLSPDKMSSLTQTIVTLTRFLLWSVNVWFKRTTKGVKTKFIWGNSLAENEVSRVIYQDFIPKALARGQYVTAPEAVVVGKGLEFIQEALDLQMKGVSAKKVVVSL